MQYNQKAADVAAEVSKAVFDKPQSIRTIWMAMLAGGHVLIEDIPRTLWALPCSSRRPGGWCTTPAA